MGSVKEPGFRQGENRAVSAVPMPPRVLGAAPRLLEVADRPRYPGWQAYFRRHQPPTLVVWGKNDHIFLPEGALPYRRDLKCIEVHLLDTGHFALEEDGPVIADHIRTFLGTHVLREAR